MKKLLILTAAICFSIPSFSKAPEHVTTAPIAIAATKPAPKVSYIVDVTFEFQNIQTSPVKHTVQSSARLSEKYSENEFTFSNSSSQTGLASGDPELAKEENQETYTYRVKHVKDKDQNESLEVFVELSVLKQINENKVGDAMVRMPVFDTYSSTFLLPIPKKDTSKPMANFDTPWVNILEEVPGLHRVKFLIQSKVD